MKQLYLLYVRLITCLFFTTFIPFSLVIADSGGQEPSKADVLAAEKYLCLKESLDESSTLLSSTPDKNQINDVLETALEVCGLKSSDNSDRSVLERLAPYLIPGAELSAFDQRVDLAGQFLKFHQVRPRFGSRSRGKSRLLALQSKAAGTTDAGAGDSCKIGDCENVDDLKRQITALRWQGTKLQKEISKMQDDYKDLEGDFNSSATSLVRKLRDVNRAWENYSRRPSALTRDRYISAGRALVRARLDSLTKKQAIVTKDLEIVDKRTQFARLGRKHKLLQDVLAECTGGK